MKAIIVFISLVGGSPYQYTNVYNSYDSCERHRVNIERSTAEIPDFEGIVVSQCFYIGKVETQGS